MPSERIQIAWFEDLAGKLVACGDRVAVAAVSRGGGLRLGTVLEITAVWDAGASKYRAIKAKVEISETSDLAGSKYNRETRQWDKKPFTWTYDVAKRIVRID